MRPPGNYLEFQGKPRETAPCPNRHVTPPRPIRLEIGTPGWEDDLRRRCAEFASDYWADLTPVSADDLRRVEQSINRVLPIDLKQFLTRFGCGVFPTGGHLSTPDELIEYSPAATIFYPLGSCGRTPWASMEEHVELYVSKGQRNPDPKRFTRAALTFDGAYLLDWLQVGSDGCCGYHNVFVGEEPPGYAYLLMCPGEVESRLSSFAAGMEEYFNRLIE